MTTTLNQQLASACSAAARLCAGLVRSAARSRVAWLALVVLGLLWPDVSQAQPTAITLPASAVSSTRETLRGSFSSGGSADVFFEYGATTNLGTTAWIATGATNLDAQPVSATITRLLPGTTYYFRLVATNLTGVAEGDLLDFTTISTNAALANLASSVGTLTPAFTPTP